MTQTRVLLSVLFAALISACDSGSSDVEVTDNTETAPYSLISTSELLSKPGENQNDCISGGVAIHSGIDRNGNEQLDSDEIQQTVFVCHGETFAPTLVNIDSEPAGSNCRKGGNKISQGTDNNLNGMLESSEVESEQFICAQHQLLISNQAIAPGAECDYGGQKLSTGVDLNDDGILSESEITGTSYLCSQPNWLYSSINCSARLAENSGISARAFDYRIDEYLNGEITVTAEIFTPQLGLSKTFHWSPWLENHHERWLQALAEIKLDIIEPYNGGYWRFEIERITDANGKAQAFINSENAKDTLINIWYLDNLEGTPVSVHWQSNLADCGGENQIVKAAD